MINSTTTPNGVTPSSTNDWTTFFQTIGNQAGLNVSSLGDFVNTYGVSSNVVKAISQSGIPVASAIASVIDFLFGWISIKGTAQHLGTTEAQSVSEKIVMPYLSIYDALPQEGKDYFAGLVDQFNILSLQYTWTWTPRWRARNVAGVIPIAPQRDRLKYIIQSTAYDYLLEADAAVISNDFQYKKGWYGEFFNRVITPLQSFLSDKLGITVQQIKAGGASDGTQLPKQTILSSLGSMGSIITVVVVAGLLTVVFSKKG